MHPSGVQFGLSRGLLQLRGEEVLLSDELLEKISVEAQAHLELGRPPIRGNFLVDLTVRAALPQKSGRATPCRLRRLSPFVRGRIQSLILLVLLSPLQRGTAAVGGRGSLKPDF